MAFFTTILGIVILIALWGVFIYNRLVRNRTRAEEAWSGIDVQLKRRRNLIPNLLETVKGYAKHEKSALEEVTRLRTGAENAKTVAEKAQAEGALSGALANVFAVAEAYPDLKASENFQQLQASLQEIEDQIQLSRRYYNGAVRDLNVMVDSFPSNIVANMFNFVKKEFFEMTDEAGKAVPKIEF
ncbi:MAG: LemA family protein [Gammaproteobacteria bacterium]|nr:MAG: LemA family protein [Gammaproteobacteria bacterium]